MKKIRIELTPEELASFLHLIGAKEQEMYRLSLSETLTLGSTDKLTANLSNSQKEETIRAQVKETISLVTGIAPSQLNDTDKLTRDLKMTSIQIRRLAIAFTSIARHYKSSVTISPDECQEQDTVQKCINLIMDKTS